MGRWQKSVRGRFLWFLSHRPPQHPGLSAVHICAFGLSSAYCLWFCALRFSFYLYLPGLCCAWLVQQQKEWEGCDLSDSIAETLQLQRCPFLVCLTLTGGQKGSVDEGRMNPSSHMSNTCWLFSDCFYSRELAFSRDLWVSSTMVAGHCFRCSVSYGN